MFTSVTIPGVIQTELRITTVMWTVTLLFSTVVLIISDCISVNIPTAFILAVLRNIKAVPVMLQFEIMKILGKISIIHVQQNSMKKKREKETA